MPFWGKEKPYPSLEYRGKRYYIIPLSAIREMEGEHVVVTGIVTRKPRIEYYSAGWPLSFERYIEENHGHRTVFTIEDVPVVARGVVLLKVGEKVKIYGCVLSSQIIAEVIIGEYAEYYC